MASPSAHNINGWHWSEKDFTDWAIAEIKKRLTFQHTLSGTEAIDVSVTEAKGEAFKNVRKGKLRSSYDFKIKMNVTYKAADKEPLEGTAVLEPFCDTEPEDWEFIFKVTDPSRYNSDLVGEARKAITSAPFLERMKEWCKVYEEIVE